MIIKIGAAVVDGVMPDESVQTPVEQINTALGTIVMSKTAVTKGIMQSIAANIVQPASVALLKGYAIGESVVTVSFVDQSLTSAKTICAARVIAVDLQPIDQGAQEYPELTTMQASEPKTVYSGSIQIVIVG